MANYPQELAQYAAYQSRTVHLTGLWFLPKLDQGLNNYNNNNAVMKCLCQVPEDGEIITPEHVESM